MTGYPPTYTVVLGAWMKGNTDATANTSRILWKVWGFPNNRTNEISSACRFLRRHVFSMACQEAANSVGGSFSSGILTVKARHKGFSIRVYNVAMPLWRPTRFTASSLERPIGECSFYCLCTILPAFPKLILPRWPQRLKAVSHR